MKALLKEKPGTGVYYCQVVGELNDEYASEGELTVSWSEEINPSLTAGEYYYYDRDTGTFFNVNETSEPEPIDGSSMPSGALREDTIPTLSSSSSSSSSSTSSTWDPIRHTTTGTYSTNNIPTNTNPYWISDPQPWTNPYVVNPYEQIQPNQPHITFGETSFQDPQEKEEKLHEEAKKRHKIKFGEGSRTYEIHVGTDKHIVKADYMIISENNVTATLYVLSEDDEDRKQVAYFKRFDSFVELDYSANKEETNAGTAIDQIEV
jgi:hypothetical protein